MTDSRPCNIKRAHTPEGGRDKRHGTLKTFDVYLGVLPLKRSPNIARFQGCLWCRRGSLALADDIKPRAAHAPQQGGAVHKLRVRVGDVRGSVALADCQSALVHLRLQLEEAHVKMTQPRESSARGRALHGQQRSLR